MSIRICPVCLKEFVPNVHNQKYCSLICQGQRRNKSYSKICPICKNEFQQHNHYKKYCSDKCNLKKRLQLQKIKRFQNKSVVTKICLTCLSIFQPRHKKQKYCCKKCVFRNKQQRYYSDENFKLKIILRSRISSAIKYNSKIAHTEELLGCSIEYLKSYLESMFKEGMSWDNYGKWHIDHIRPCCSFDLSDPEQQRMCFNYSNLQPLWAEENWRKNRKY